jgi:hypothetical protein
MVVKMAALSEKKEDSDSVRTNIDHFIKSLIRVLSTVVDVCFLYSNASGDTTLGPETAFGVTKSFQRRQKSGRAKAR